MVAGWPLPLWHKPPPTIHKPTLNPPFLPQFVLVTVVARLPACIVQLYNTTLHPSSQQVGRWRLAAGAPAHRNEVRAPARCTCLDSSLVCATRFTSTNLSLRLHVPATFRALSSFDVEIAHLQRRQSTALSLIAVLVKALSCTLHES